MPWSWGRLGQTLAPYWAASADQEKAPEAEAQVPVPGHRTPDTCGRGPGAQGQCSRPAPALHRPAPALPRPPGRYRGVGAAQQADHQQEDPAARIGVGASRCAPGSLRHCSRGPRHRRGRPRVSRGLKGTRVGGPGGAGLGGAIGSVPAPKDPLGRRVVWEGRVGGVALPTLGVVLKPGSKPSLRGRKKSLLVVANRVTACEDPS